MWCHSHEFQIFTCQILCIFVQAKESYSRHTGGASMGQRVQWTVLDSLTHHAWSLSREWCVVRKDQLQGLRLRSFETVLSGCALHRCRCQTPPSVTPPDQSVAALTTCSVHISLWFIANFTIKGSHAVYASQNTTALNGGQLKSLGNVRQSY